MKLGRLAALLVVVLVPLTLDAAPAAAAALVRYRDSVFPKVDHTYDIPYRTVAGETLSFDWFEPHGDRLTARPLVIWLHGGSFIDGDKATNRPDAEWFAHRGYVAASMNYRLDEDGDWVRLNVDNITDPQFKAAVTAAYQDIRGGIAYFRNNAARYGIDPERISVAGFSAGAITALNAAYQPNRAAGGGTTSDPARVTGAVLSYAGLTDSDYLETGEPESLMHNGVLDTIVSHAHAMTFCNDANDEGILCQFDSRPGDHGITPDWNWTPLHEQSAAFLYDHVIAPAPTGAAALGGVVVGAGLGPVAGATVRVTNSTGDQSVTVASATTNAQGRWLMQVNPGSYSVSVSAPGHVKEWVDDQSKQSSNYPVVLTPGNFRIDTILQPKCGSPPEFPDVTTTSTFCGEVEWMAAQGYANGYADGTFRPTASLTRQAFVAYLYRLGGRPALPPGAPTFSDVPPGHPFEKEIRWAASQGIVGGFADGTFHPTDVLSRQAFAAYLYRMAGEPQGPFPTSGLVPISPTHPFFLELEWLWASGVEAINWRTGWEAMVAFGVYGPTAPVQRQTVAASFHRLAGAYALSLL